MTKIKTKLKKGDNVLVLSGKDKGKTGSILSIILKKNRAIVKGIHIVKKHQKPDKKSAGGIVEKELPVHLSNLSIISAKDGKSTKIGIKLDNNKKIRFEKKTGEIIKNG
jgi:large subunit ribosomal protein L24